MKIKYYGTAAAEGVPALYCDCDVCTNSKKAGGKNIRTRSQALIDDSLLIDMPPDTLYHCQFHSLPLSQIENVLITHKHADHLHTPTLAVRSGGFIKKELSPLNIYGSMPSIDLIFDDLRKSGVLDRGKWNLNELMPYETYTVDNFFVTPLKANHAFETYPYIYIISSGKKSLFYGHDTGYFLDETWLYLENNKPHFDLISLDCTMGLSESKGHKHMNLDDCINVRKRLMQIGCADEKTLFILNHFSHNGKASYDDMVKSAEGFGFTVSYDGMVIEF